MSLYSDLKAFVRTKAYTNGNNEITGQMVQDALVSMITSLGTGYQYMGVATTSTNPGTLDQKVFYLASEVGTYSNFGGLTVADGEFVVLYYDSSWHKAVTGAATKAAVDQLGQKVDKIGDGLQAEDVPIVSSIIDYTPKGVASFSGAPYYWAALQSKTMPDREGSGILKTIKVLSAPSVNTSFGIKLYKKVWANGQITGFIAVANGEYNFTWPAGETEFDTTSYNILIDPDVIIGINAVAKYESVGGGAYGIYNGHYQNKYTDFSLNIDYFIELQGVRLVRIDNLEEEVDIISDILDIGETVINESIIDYTPAGGRSFSGVPYFWAALGSKTMPDREQSGVLKKIVVLTAPASNTSFKIKLYKKVWNNGQITGFTEVANGEYSFVWPAGETELDVSSSAIEIAPDVIIAINAVAEYSRTSDAYAVYNGNYSSAFDGNFSLGVDYFIEYSAIKSATITQIEDDIEELQKNAPSEELSLKNAHIVVLGDSITWLGGDDCDGRETPSKGWTTYFKNVVSPKSILSYARSGATWSHTENTQYDITENTGSLSDDNVIYNQINRLLAAVSGGTQATPDIIIIAAGTNDAWYPAHRPDALSVDADTEFADTSGYITSQAVGTLTSIAAAMRYDIELLKTNFPNCQIFVTTPLQSKAFTLTKCFNVGQLIKDCAKYLSVECIDQAAEAGIYRAQENVGYLFTYDGTHTSALGAKMVGQFLAKKVLAEYHGKLA